MLHTVCILSLVLQILGRKVKNDYDWHMYLKKGKNKNIVIYDDLVLKKENVCICIIIYFLLLVISKKNRPLKLDIYLDILKQTNRYRKNYLLLLKICNRKS